uniref:Homeobox C6 n=1 Tax=Calidris pygmaea TaxID=425635 RepID=A0A8C3KN29_9CHAR
MNSYFTNPSLSCHLTSGQEVLPNVALNSTAYDPVRHFSTYGAAVAQNRIYSSPFYSPQDNVVFSSSRGPYDYGSNAFYQEKDMLSSCRQNSMGHNTQTSIAQDFTSDQNRNTSQEQKTSIQIYPWMQRMNSHSGKAGNSDFKVFICLSPFEERGWFLQRRADKEDPGFSVGAGGGKGKRNVNFGALEELLREEQPLRNPQE